MLISSFDDREREVLIAALRYWRAHRQGGQTRRADPPLTPDTIDLLLAKLRSVGSSLPPDDFSAGLR
jgi:hypothetical protein